MRGRFLAIALLVVAGALTYLGASQAGFLGIDDVRMIGSVSSESYTLRSLFLSGANEYYRPLAVISYVLSLSLGGADPGFFHLTNVALHIVNSLLVYWLALELCGGETEKRGLPLIAALHFLVTPLNSEAVMWVSARPDLLCSFFFLLAVIQLVKRRNDPSLSALGFFSFAFLASLCSKEASIALSGAAPLYLLIEYRRERVTHPCAARRDALLWGGAVSAVTLLYLFLRTGKKLALDSGVTAVVHGVIAKGAPAAAGKPLPAHPSLLDGVGAYGFYLKKLLLPLPLNFTILDYQRPAAFLALALALPVGWWLLRRFRAAPLPLLIVLMGIAPAILAYLGGIAWTPLGERYLYLPMIGFSLLAAMALCEIPRLPRVIPVLFLLLLSLITRDRVSLWCDRSAFWHDALEKGPGFAQSYSALGSIALEEKRYDEAEQHLRQAMSLGFDNSLIWQNLALVHLKRHEYDRYEAAMNKAASLSPRPTGIYQDLIVGLMSGRNAETALSTTHKAIKYHLLSLSRDPSNLDAYYHVGKLYLSLGDRPNAQRYLTLYTEKVKGGYYRPFAEKMIRKIGVVESTRSAQGRFPKNC